MTTRKIKISQLTELTSASLNTTLVGVENGVTYKMELDTVADAITSAVNTSDRSRIDALESVTGSYLTSLPNDVVSGSEQLTSSYDERYILSGSITQTTWDNIDGKPSGLVSESTDLSPLNSFTASYFTDSSSFDTRVLTEKGRIDAILSASNANTDTFAEIVSLINSVDLDNDNAFATFYTSSNARVSSLENATGSYLTSLEGSISSSDQLTSSFDTRYTLSGSVQPLPDGLISGSSQLTSSFDERYTLSGSFVSSTNVESIQTITSASYAALTPVSGTLYIIIG